MFEGILRWVVKYRVPGERVCAYLHNPNVQCAVAKLSRLWCQLTTNHRAQIGYEIGCVQTVEVSGLVGKKAGSMIFAEARA